MFIPVGQLLVDIGSDWDRASEDLRAALEEALDTILGIRQTVSH
jgi:hypothetical protein